jgi:polyhydroxyalkanoate synthesis regulator phasin
MDSEDKTKKADKGPSDPAWDDLGNGAGTGAAGTGAGSKMGDTIKKLLATGVSAAFMTEESIRRLVTDMHLPKETINLLLQGATRSKEELMNKVSREVITIISKIDFVKEASRFVEEHKFRVTAEIEVLPKTNTATTVDPNSKIEIKL